MGKSTACGLFLDWAVKRQMPVSLVDGDTRNPDVSRMFADSMPTLQANLRIHEGWMDMTDFMMDQTDKAIVISLPAGIGAELRKEAARFCQTVAMLERPLSMFWIINRLPDSVNLLNEAMQVLDGSLASKVVVKTCSSATKRSSAAGIPAKRRSASKNGRADYRHDRTA